MAARIGGAPAVVVSLGIAVAAALSFGGCSGRDTKTGGGNGGGASAAAIEVARSPVEELAAIDAFAPRLESAVELQRVGARVVVSSKRASRRVTSLPGRAPGAVRLQQAPGVWIEIAPLERADVPAELEANALLFRGAEPDTDVVMLLDGQRFEEIRILRGAAAPATARYRLRFGSGIASVRANHGGIEVLDRRGRVAFQTEPAFAVDSAGTRRSVELTLAGEEPLVHAKLDTRGLSYPVYVDPSWIFGSPNDWPAPVLTALGSVWIRRNSTIMGDVAVLDAAPGPTLDSGVEASIGKSVSGSG